MWRTETSTPETSTISTKSTSKAELLTSTAEVSTSTAKVSSSTEKVSSSTAKVLTSTAKVLTSTAKVSTSAAKVPRLLKPTVESQFQCQLYSIPLQFKCDGTIHCIPDGSDEEDCPEAPTISSPTSIPLIRAPANHKELRVEFKDKKTAWKSKKNVARKM